MDNPLPFIETVSKNFGELFSSGTHLDVILIVGESSIRSNRLLLAAASDYFRALFKFDRNALYRSEFTLEAEHLSSRGVRYAIEYIHSLGLRCGHIPFERFIDVYAAASFLQIPSLIQKMKDLILSGITIGNALCKRDSLLIPV